MKNHFLISDKEKNRIRNLHESRKQSFGTGNLITEQIVLSDKGELTNEQKYELLASGQATAKDIAQIMKSAIGMVQDDEAVMQVAVSAIKDMGVFKAVSSQLNKDVVNWLIKKYSTKKDDYKKDFYGGKGKYEGKKFPTIFAHLDTLGVIRDLDNNNRASLASVIQDPFSVKTNQPGDIYNP